MGSFLFCNVGFLQTRPLGEYLKLGHIPSGCVRFFFVCTFGNHRLHRYNEGRQNGRRQSKNAINIRKTGWHLPVGERLSSSQCRSTGEFCQQCCCGWEFYALLISMKRSAQRMPGTVRILFCGRIPFFKILRGSAAALLSYPGSAKPGRAAV